MHHEKMYKYTGRVLVLFPNLHGSANQEMPHLSWLCIRITYKKFWEAEEEAETYCRQPAGTLTPGIGPR
jgi:hypothetical protein